MVKSWHPCLVQRLAEDSAGAIHKVHQGMWRNQEGGWEDTDKGQWPRGLGKIIAIFCSVPGELKEAIPIRSLVGTPKDSD